MIHKYVILILSTTVFAWNSFVLIRFLLHLMCLTVQPNCLRGLVVCVTVYGDIHLKDLLGSIVRVGYCIPVPDFYLVLHGIKKHYNEWINQSKRYWFDWFGLIHCSGFLAAGWSVSKFVGTRTCGLHYNELARYKQ